MFLQVSLWGFAPSESCHGTSVDCKNISQLQVSRVVFSIQFVISSSQASVTVWLKMNAYPKEADILGRALVVAVNKFVRSNAEGTWGNVCILFHSLPRLVLLFYLF